LINLCLFKVGWLFSKLAIQSLFVSSFFSPVKKRNVMFGWSCTIEHTMYCTGLLLIRVPMLDNPPQVHSRASNVNFVLLERGLQTYLLYVQMSIHCVEYAFTVIYLLLIAEIFKSTFHSYHFFWSCDRSPYWSLA
jgi:hypothetical protein